MHGDMKIVGGTLFQEQLTCGQDMPHSSFTPICNRSSGLLNNLDREFLKIKPTIPISISLPIAQLKDPSHYPDERPKKDYGIGEYDPCFTPGYIFPMKYAHDEILESLAEKKARRAEKEKMSLADTYIYIDPDPLGLWKWEEKKARRAEKEKMSLADTYIYIDPDPLGLWKKK